MKAESCNIPSLWIAAMLLCCGCISPRSSDESANDVLHVITKNVESGTVSRVTIFFLPYNVRTSVSVGPEHLQERPVLTTNIAGELHKDLVQALKNTHGRRSKYLPDLRWGAHFLTNEGTCLHTTYLDRSGRGTVMDGKIFTVNRALFRWFEKYFYRIGTDVWAVKLRKESPGEH